MKNTINKILEHPDKDEILSKLIIGTPTSDINEWLKAKYSNISEAKYVIGEKALKTFKEDYLNLYNIIKQDLTSTKTAISKEEEMQLTIQNNSTYKSKMIELANGELDIRKMLGNMILAVETRAGQIFDEIQENSRDLNSKSERLFLEYCDRLGQNLERWSKYVLQTPDHIVQHNVTVQHVDQHVQIMQEAIRETLAELDNEASLRFMEIFEEKVKRLKLPNENVVATETRLAEVKILNNEINKKLNE